MAMRKVSKLPPVRQSVPSDASSPGRRLGVWVERLAPAHAEPGEWFEVPGDWSASMAGQLRQGRVRGVARGEYRVSHRHLGGGRYRLYVMVEPGQERETATPAGHGYATQQQVREASLDQRWAEDGLSLVFLLPSDAEHPDPWWFDPRHLTPR